MVDTIELIECPACGKMMHKVFMEDEGLSLDVCLDGCGGIFFNNRELKKFDERHENIDELKNMYEGKTFNPVDENITRKCSVCGNNMVKNHVSAKKEITIDECYSCGAKFFDFGELKKMRSQYATEADRKQDFLSLAHSLYGAELNELEIQNNLNRSNRSLLLKIMDRFFLGR